ncbi:hypothetical protein MMC14_007017 [Varicellaria rhodocarpa]|nr:hypothetical protein [Varicellaria rhodocarpa]
MHRYLLYFLITIPSVPQLPVTASSATDLIPQNCLHASSTATTQAHPRRELHTREAEPNTSRDVEGRGNPICYYIGSRASELMTTTSPSIPFILPAGLWALNWELGRPRGRTFVAGVYFKVFQIAPTGAEMFVTFVFESGRTFTTDGLKKYVLYMDQLRGPPHLEAEVWVQAKD